MLLASIILIMLMGKWENDVVGMVEEMHGKNKVSIPFECDTLKAEKAAEEHIRQFMPKLDGLDVVVKIGRMSLKGLEFNAEEAENSIMTQETGTTSSGEVYYSKDYMRAEVSSTGSSRNGSSTPRSDRDDYRSDRRGSKDLRSENRTESHRHSYNNKEQDYRRYASGRHDQDDRL